MDPRDRQALHLPAEGDVLSKLTDNARRAGARAREQGAPITDCPYGISVARQFAVEWLRGWREEDEKIAELEKERPE